MKLAGSEKAEEARSHTAADRLREAERRTWKESRFPAGPGNHTVIYKLSYSSPDMTLQLPLQQHNSRLRRDKQHIVL